MSKLKVGMSASFSKKFDKEEVESFAEISGDMNPIHLNREYAEKSLFGKRIVHGFLYSSLITLSYPALCR